MKLRDDETAIQADGPKMSPQDTNSSTHTRAPITEESWTQRFQSEWAITRNWAQADRKTWGRRLTSPIGSITVALVLLIALVGYGLSTAKGSAPETPASTSSSSSSSMSMGTSASSASTASNIPNATQSTGNQPAKFVMEAGGIKHFTFTAQQVNWEVVKGQRVVAYTLDGTVPGPMIHATAGDHLRITIVNHLSEPTAIHWHGLEVPTDNDGVPPVGMKPIEPGQSYTYDFTLRDEDAGTHWYHSHYHDLAQVGGGLYGAFIIDPRPGSPEAQHPIQSNVDYMAFLGRLGSFYVINGKSFPDTQPINVTHGQTVHIRLIGADTMMAHPMHLHGHTFSIVAEDGHALAQPILKDTVNVSPGETYDLTFSAWAAPGSVYPFHCHILTHLMNPGQSGSEMGGLIALLEYAK